MSCTAWRTTGTSVLPRLGKTDVPVVCHAVQLKLLTQRLTQPQSKLHHQRLTQNLLKIDFT
jgi:hypothetical protein